MLSPKQDVECRIESLESELKDASFKLSKAVDRIEAQDVELGRIREELESAQSGAQDVTFGKITCRELTVVDDEGNPSVVLSIDPHGGVVGVISKDGNYGVQSSNNDNGGAVVAFGKDGKGAASLYNNEHGGAVKAYGKDGGQAQFGNDEYGGAMALFDKGGNRTGRLP